MAKWQILWAGISISLAILLVSSVLVPIGDVYATTTFVDSFDVSGQEIQPSGLAFNADGTKMFVVGADLEEINEYVCTTGFDVSTCSFTEILGENPIELPEDDNPRDLAFNSDGKKMFVVGNLNDNVYEYACSAAFDVSTCVYSGDGELFDVSTEDDEPQGLTFNSDGTKMFVVGNQNDNVYEYACAAFDVSTCTFTVKTGNPFDVSTEDVTPTGLAFSTDGTEMFVTGVASKNVNQYTLTTGFDVSTASFVDSFSVTTEGGSPQGLAFSSDGLKMFVITGGNNVDDEINTYTLEVAFDLFSSPSGSGSSCSDCTPPSIVTTFDDADYPVSVGSTSYTAEQLKYPVDTTTVETGKPLQISLLLYDNGGPQNISHVAIYVDRDGTAILNDLTETYIVWDKNKDIQIINPYGIISNGTVESSIQDNKVSFTFDVTFAKEFDKPDILFVVWDAKRNVMKVLVQDALQVILAEPVPEPDVVQDSEPRAESVVTTEEFTVMDPEPGVDIIILEQIITIKQWAGYDVESVTDEQMLDSLGINMDDSKQYQIPSWAKNSLASWYVSGKITYDEFKTAIQYMYHADKTI